MMPLHRRHIAGTKDEDDGEGGLTSTATATATGQNKSSIGMLSTKNNNMNKNKNNNNNNKTRYRSVVLSSLLILQIILVIMAIQKTRKITSTTHLISLIVATITVSLPVILSLGVGLGVLNTTPQDLLHQRYIPLTVAATIIGNQFPVYISSAMAAIGITIFGLASRPVILDDNNNSMKKGRKYNTQSPYSALSGPLKTVLAVLLMIGVLLTENYFVWIVSATYKPSQNPNFDQLPTPLQDNGQITMRYLLNTILGLSKRDIIVLRNMISVEWILVSGLGLSLVAVELQGQQMQRNLWSMALRGVLTLAAARFIRTISFLITVLPSQSPKCYFGHFPFPPPTEWIPWLLEGLKPQVNGGCNDLIISGHATVTSTLACIVTSIVGKPLFTTSLWMFVAMDYMVEVYEGFHYSVDMWLGAVIVNFIWTTLAPLEHEDNSDKQEGDDDAKTRKFYSLQDATTSDVIRYFLPALGTYIQVVGIIPQNLGNYTIISYVIVVIFQLYRYGFQQYTQHFLFCLLYMALGVYL
jgi:hypothetical protein